MCMEFIVRVMVGMVDLGRRLLDYGAGNGRIGVRIISGFVTSFLGNLTVLNLCPFSLISLCMFALLLTLFLSTFFACLGCSYDNDLLIVRVVSFDSLRTF